MYTDWTFLTKKVDLAEDLKRLRKRAMNYLQNLNCTASLNCIFFLDFCLGTNEQSKSSAKLIKYFEKKPRFRRKSQRKI